MRSWPDRVLDPPAVDLPAKRLMLGDLVMGRVVVGLDLARDDRVVIWFDNRMFMDVQADDRIPVDKPLEER